MPRMKTGHAFRIVLIALAGALFLLPQPALAYIGPGAGFALLSSFLVVFTTILIALLSLLIWPFRMAWRFFRRKSRTKPWSADSSSSASTDRTRS